MNPAQFPAWPGDAPDVDILYAEIPRDLFIECLVSLPTAQEWVSKLSQRDDAYEWDEQCAVMEEVTPEIVTWDRVDGFDDFMHRIPKPDRHKLSDEPLMWKLIQAHAKETRLR